MLSLDTPLSQYKNYVIAPVLKSMGVYTPQLAALVAGIGLKESGYRLIAQMNGGPARGYWQMEPFTHDDCWNNYLKFPRQSKIATALRALAPAEAVLRDQLITNTAYAAGMCAVKCIRGSVPTPTTAAGMAAFWKRYYNTAAGAGVVDAETVSLFLSAIAA